MSERPCTCHPDDSPPKPCAQKYALTECRTSALADAMEQLLDDMGKHGASVSLAAKAQARIAWEPYRTADYDDYLMTLAEARRIAHEANR